MTDTTTTTVLDDAFERMAASSAFELPNGFVNHGPMGCEALAALGLDEEIDAWARRFERVPGPAVTPVPTRRLEWTSALGDYRRLPQWIGHFQIAIEEHGWAAVLEVWAPRLMPALSTKLFHGAIRTAHAARALTVADTSARRTELARALGYWAARFTQGHRSGDAGEEADGDLHLGVGMAAADAARYYLAAPSILYLHGVTGAMAVELLVAHVPQTAAQAALAQLRAEHSALYPGAERRNELHVRGASQAELARKAAASGDVHQVKLIEACRRGLAITGDAGFLAAAEAATGVAVSP